MNKLMTKDFHKWTKENQITQTDLIAALDEFENGLYEANLGANVYKKRISAYGKGKRGGGRTIIFYKVNLRIIFVYGFSKNEKSNISKKELEAFKIFAKALLDLDDNQISKALNEGVLLEVKS